MKIQRGCLVVPPPCRPGASSYLRVETADGQFCLHPNDWTNVSAGDRIDVRYVPEDQFAMPARKARKRRTPSLEACDENTSHGEPRRHVAIERQDTEAGTRWILPAGTVWLGSDRMRATASLMGARLTASRELRSELAAERALFARAHRFAAEVLEASGDDRWAVVCDANAVHIEVCETDAGEPERAAALLVRLLGEVQP